MTRKARGPMTAADLMAELDQDAEYQQKVAERKAQQDEESERLQDEEQPILADLAAVGVETDSVWNLYKTPEARAKAMPVLIEHMSRDYSPKVHEGIGQALSHRSARAWWSQLKELYLGASDPTVRDRLAAVLSDIAVKAHYDDLLAFLADESLGTTRIYFIRPVNRIGNRMSPGKGRSVIEPLADDPTLGPEAKQVLAGRSRND